MLVWMNRSFDNVEWLNGRALQGGNWNRKRWHNTAITAQLYCTGTQFSTNLNLNVHLSHTFSQFDQQHFQSIPIFISFAYPLCWQTPQQARFELNVVDFMRTIICGIKILFCHQCWHKCAKSMQIIPRSIRHNILSIEIMQENVTQLRANTSIIILNRKEQEVVNFDGNLLGKLSSKNLFSINEFR